MLYEDSGLQKCPKVFTREGIPPEPPPAGLHPRARNTRGPQAGREAAGWPLRMFVH